MPELLSATETDVRPDAVHVPRLGDGDHERFSHIVAPSGDKTAQALVTEARVFGTPVEALCGKRWVPSRDPKNHPVCPDCKAIFDGHFGEGESDGLDG